MHLELPLVIQQAEWNLFVTSSGSKLMNTCISKQLTSSENWSHFKFEAQNIIKEYVLISAGNIFNWGNVVSLNGKKIKVKRLYK